MENRLNDIEELIGKYLAGEASAEERKTVEIWLREREENGRYFDHLKLIFDQSTQVKEMINVDVDAAWSKVKTHLQRDERKVVPLHTPAGNLFWRIAASLIIVMGVGFFAYRMLGPGKPIEVVAETKIVADTLPDGSEVVLNKKTKLTYAYNKRKKEHTVKLNGEAYFSIHHEDKKNFIIESDGVFIRDIGTSFNVKAYPESNTIEVVVEEGEVVFYTESNAGVSLHAKAKGVYNRITKEFSIELPEKNATSYKSRVFEFENTHLGDLIEELNKVYDTHLIVSDSLRNCRLTVNFENESIEEIAAVISETLKLTVRKTNDGIVLEGKSCEH